ncbi:MAG: hypothetical protein GXY15_09255 [Candidatus Hydrogenedentes bacterium]|nr:hypothetical protein [Candidatus Hydrogenedentota bacterium]
MTAEAMTKENRPGVFLRWIVPAIYAFCLALVLMNTVTDYRRIVLAEDIAEALRREPPQTLPELRDLLGPHLRGVYKRSAGIGVPEHDVVWLSLKPRVWMRVVAECTPGTETLQAVRLIYASSEEVSLDNPRERLPSITLPGVILFGVIPVLLSLLFSRLWLWASRPAVPRPVHLLAGAVAAVPLLAVVPIGALFAVRLVLCWAP